MPELIDQLLDNEQQAQADALRDYRELLGRRHEPEPGDADALRRVMVVLRLTPRDVEADGHALGTAANLARQILPPDELEKVKATRGEAKAKFESDLRALLVDMVNNLDPLTLPGVVNVMLTWAGGVPKGEKPYADRQREIGATWVAADNRHLSATSMSQQNAQALAAVRAKNPRVFAD